MKNVRLTFAALALGFLLAGCYKSGCTNPEATNYNPDVKSEDMSCTYSGNVVFWTTSTLSDSLIDLGHEMLRFELEGEIVDSISTLSLRSATGDCNAGGTKTIALNFPGNTERYYKYRVKGLDFVTIYEDIITVESNGCTIVKLD